RTTARYSTSLFFFPHTAPPEIYTLSLHDALPICGLIGRTGDRYEFVHVLLRDAVLRLQLRPQRRALHQRIAVALDGSRAADTSVDRKSTRLNSSHVAISYAVFCLKKKRKNNIALA